MERPTKTFVIYSVSVLLMVLAFGIMRHFAPKADKPISLILFIFGGLLAAESGLGLIVKAIATKRVIARSDERPFDYWSQVVG
jgi:hypothetical protein